MASHDDNGAVPVDTAMVDRSKTALRRALRVWYRKSARDLPWRRTRDPYRIWLSEIMLQQTRVEAVKPYYARFVKAFPRVRDLAAADEDRVLKLWEGLGYYSRARNLHRAARQIVSEHGGRLPRSAAAWRALPGVGRYTAGAIASIAFDERVAVLDGNVKRVLARLFCVEACIDDTATVDRLWQIADTLVPPRGPGEFNQALMELGARVCTPKGPACEACPVRRSCRAHRQGREAALPVRRAKKRIPHYHVVAAAIRRNGRYLLGKRPPNGMLGGLWELPGGKVEPGETHEQALTREVREELDLAVRVGRRIASVDHAYTHFSITLHVYECVPNGGRPKRNYHTALRWVPRSQFDRYALPAANLKCLHLL